MPMIQVMLIILSVGMVATGQLLFKKVSLTINAEGTWVAASVAGWFCLSMIIYLTATLLWIHILRSANLAVAYPFMALSFIIVPLLSNLFYGDHIAPHFIIGSLMVFLGLILVSN